MYRCVCRSVGIYMIRFDSVAFSRVVDALTCFVCYALCVRMRCVVCVVLYICVENEREFPQLEYRMSDV